MKRFLALILGLLVLTGCSNKDMKENYDNMSIGNSIDSYQLDLRMYGSINGKTANNMYKISNYKNEQYTIQTNDATYYMLDGKTYKTVNEQTNNDDSINSDYKEVNETIFHDTDIFLSGLKNLKTKEKTDNDMASTGEYTVYNVTLKDAYVKDLLEALDFGTEYKDCSGKIYIDSNNNVYRIIYKIDALTLNGAFFRINSINGLDISQIIKG